MRNIGSKWSRRRVTTACQALLAAAIVATLAMLLIHESQPEYEARISLVAGPSVNHAPARANTPAAPQPAGDFASVVSLGFPALTPLAHTPQILTAAHDLVPGSPPAHELSSMVTVELMPAAAVARISVHAASPDMARELVKAVADQLVQSDLLAPVATLRPLDLEPEVAQVKPDGALSLGFALVAAALAAVGVVAVRGLFNPSIDQRVSRLLKSAGVSHDVAAIRFKDSDVYERIGLLARAAESPVRVLPTQPSLLGESEKLIAGLAERGIPLRDEASSGGAAACVCVVKPGRDLAMLSVTVAALPGPYRLVAVVVT